VIADEFTFANVEKVTSAILAELVSEGRSGSTLIVAHDSRFMGEAFSTVAANIAAAKGYRVLRCTGPTPTPTVAHAIRANNAIGGINFTASHNPPEYQGIKFSTADGAPALPEITTRIEANYASNTVVSDANGGEIAGHDPRPAYLDDLRSKVKLDLIASAGGKFVYDPLWGTGRGYLDKILRDAGVEVDTLHDWRDVTFGGQPPEPGEEHVGELRRAVIENGYKLGIATDGDGDRFGVIDSDGTFIAPNKFIALLADYLYESRGWHLGLARSVATSHQIDRVAKSRGVELHETPVGFKYIGELIIKDQLILGGEESAGLSIRGHYPEKDGLIACLLAAEMVAARGATIGEQLEALYKRDGRLESGRIGVKLTPEVAAKLKEKLAEDPSEIAGRAVRSINRLDGVKFLFGDDRWMLMRPSGTEPMVRIYAEAADADEVNALMEAGRSYLLS